MSFYGRDSPDSHSTGSVVLPVPKGHPSAPYMQLPNSHLDMRFLESCTSQQHIEEILASAQSASVAYNKAQ